MQAVPLGGTEPRGVATAAAVALRTASGRYPWSKGFPVPRSYSDYLVVKARANALRTRTRDRTRAHTPARTHVHARRRAST